MNTQDTLAKASDRPVKARSVPRPATDADHARAAAALAGIDSIKTAAQRWYDRELERCAAAHGKRWAEHREWVEAYLQEELRQRLTNRGWVWPRT